MLVAASSVLLLTLSCYDIYVFATRALPLERPVPTATGQPTSTTWTMTTTYPFQEVLGATRAPHVASATGDLIIPKRLRLISSTSPLRSLKKNFK